MTDLVYTKMNLKLKSISFLYILQNESVTCEQHCLESVATTVNMWDACALELMDSGRYKTKECTCKEKWSEQCGEVRHRRRWRPLFNAILELLLKW